MNRKKRRKNVEKKVDVIQTPKATEKRQNFTAPIKEEKTKKTRKKVEKPKVRFTMVLPTKKDVDELDFSELKYIWDEILKSEADLDREDPAFEENSKKHSNALKLISHARCSTCGAVCKYSAAN